MDNYKDGLGAIIVFLIIIIGFLFFHDPNPSTKEKIQMTDGYDSFYSDCVDHLSGKIIVSSSLIDEIQDPDMFVDLEFQGDTSSEDPEDVCKELDEFSKDETHMIINDIDNPSREDQPTKDCDGRGCTYSN